LNQKPPNGEKSPGPESLNGQFYETVKEKLTPNFSSNSSKKVK